MIDQMKQLAGGFQNLLGARTAVLVRRYGAHETMERGSRIVLAPQPQTHAQRDELRTEPEDPTLNRAAPQSTFVNRTLILRRDVTDRDAARFDRSLIRLSIVLQIGLGQWQQT